MRAKVCVLQIFYSCLLGALLLTRHGWKPHPMPLKTLTGSQIWKQLLDKMIMPEAWSSDPVPSPCTIHSRCQSCWGTTWVLGMSPKCPAGPELWGWNPIGCYAPFRGQLEVHSCLAVYSDNPPARGRIFSLQNVEWRVKVHLTFIKFHKTIYANTLWSGPRG